MECYQIEYPDISKAGQNGAFLEDLSSFGSFHDKDSYTRFCEAVLAAWKKHSGRATPMTVQFDEVLGEIEANEPGSIRTPWGGVLVKIHEHPHVEKYLAVKRGTFLSFEKHEMKEERGIVKEGCGVSLYRRLSGGPLEMRLLSVDEEFEVLPGHEHCLIGVEDFLVYEISEDHKGIDQDLIFPFD